MVDVGPAAPPVTPARRVRERTWFQALVVVAVVAAFVLVVVRIAHRDVVAQWAVVAACPADAVPATVSTTLDTSACTTPPTRTSRTRGWPIVPVTLPAAAGLDPQITRVLSDKQARTFRVEYSAPSGAAVDAGGTVLVLVEVPASALPPTPFTIEGSTGPVTVTRVPGS